ncbi:glycosyltransferase [Aridibaculum aurantiacum]|uniref:glycosyltransferase n=1 Tax=Aridibaculum aurantiacum TaxID=2810307 RepID=UPI001A9741E4
MNVSIIIVNYNVRYFLEQCLHSVYRSINGLQAEVFVVDNASTDGSIEYLQPKFPWVKFIASPDNLGFAKANNLALYQCSGEYVLFLNPDTLLPEDCLQKCYDFMKSHTDAGALGIRMLDGSGKFLPESKRSFPSPTTSFYKLVGLHRLFPTSRVFGKYSLGYLDEHSNHEVDVLAGAYLMARRDLLLELKGYDETFFMYGEDVDLSYRIQKAGYKNYYFSGSSIIHFKGESTRKGSLNYVKMFYQAMSIFVSKHYSGSKARLFTFFIQLAIVLRAGVSAVVNFIVKIGLPLFDALFILAAFHLVNELWINIVRDGDAFNPRLINISLPGFTLVFLVAATLAGIYDNKYKPFKAFYAAIVATVVMLAVYSLLPEKYRFSRGVILFGGLMALAFITLFRWMLQNWGMVEDDDEEKRQQQTLVVATADEYKEIVNLLNQAGLANRLMGRIAANGAKENSVTSLDQLQLLIENTRVREVIFSQGYLSYKKIIDLIQQFPSNVCVRFHANGSHSIVGSDSKDTSGEFVSVEGKFQLAHPYQRRMKRIVDVSLALFILITFPVHILLCGFKSMYNALMVLVNKKTWVGFSSNSKGLPQLLPGVLTTTGDPASMQQLQADAYQIDLWYARQYTWTHDLKIIIRNYKKLGQ